MVIDSLNNAHKYFSLHPRFEKSFNFIHSLELHSLHPEKYAIEGSDIHASVSSKEGVKAGDAKFEAHNNYIDIQVCPEGVEEFGWTPRHKCHQPIGEYNTEKDVTFFADIPKTYFKLHAGEFAIFFPEDVHAPMIGEGPIKKLVVKIKI